MANQYAPLPQYAPVPSGYYPEVDQLPHGAVALKDFSAAPPPAYAYPAAAYAHPPQQQQHQQQQQYAYEPQETLVPAAPHHRHLHPSLYVSALVLGILSFVLFWPLCIIGLILAHCAMKKINRDTTHPNYGIVRAAVIVNMVSLIVGIVVAVIACVILGVEWLVLMQRPQHNYRFLQTVVTESGKRMVLR